MTAMWDILANNWPFFLVGQYPNGRPALEDVYTPAILEATANDRPKLGRRGA